MVIDNQTRELAKDLIRFLKKKFDFECFPKVKFVADKQNAGKIFGRTGHYEPESKEIVIYVTNRHPKDILRSLAHETIHHLQNCEGQFEYHDMGGTQDPNYIMKDDFLKMIEADAFERGNLAFREWEAYHKGYKAEMNESQIVEKKKKNKAKRGKIPKNKLGKYKSKLRSIADRIHKDNPNMSDEKKFKIASAAAKKTVGVNEQAQKEPEVKVNEAITNSNTYIPSDRAMADAYNARDERVFNYLMKKFGIKKD